jgi:preprotein translocase subunit SecA
VFGELSARVNEVMNKAEFSGVEGFLDDAYPRMALCAWLNYQFGLSMSPSEFADLEPPEVNEKISQKVREHYEEKEVMFPVAVGLTRFSSDSQSVDKYNKEHLVHWVNSRFQCNVTVDDLKGKSHDAIEEFLAKCSKDYLEKAHTEPLDDYLDRAYGERNGRDPREDKVQDPSALPQLAGWAKSELNADIDPKDLEDLTREDARGRVLSEFDKRYRPELCQAERALVLEVLDQAWKDHLYYMDHLRSGIGLVGYAQKDPKVEYKREGRKAFQSMWDRIGQQVTQAIFRLEQESPNFVGSLWQITATQHAEAQSVTSAESEEGQLPGQSEFVVETIRNREDKVGRNDPCPCGSGKKYKKCHGAGA